jgi:hypothetical protein
MLAVAGVRLAVSGRHRLRASPKVAAYFGAANGAATSLYSYNERGGEISSTGGVKLQRER